MVTKTTRLLILAIVALLTSAFAQGQTHDPLKWNFTTVSLNESEASLIFTASLKDGWHIYSQFIEIGGPVPTTFSFQPSDDYSLIGKVKEEGTPYKFYDKLFSMNIIWFKRTVVFSQKVKVYSPTTIIKGKIKFMVCTEEMCLPPDEIGFSMAVKVDKQEKKKSNKRLQQ